MKKVNFEDYKIRLIDSLNYIEEKKLIKILNIFTKKIIKKKKYICLWEWWIRSNFKSLYM